MAMTDSRCCLSGLQVVIIALIAVLAVRSLVDGTATESNLSPTVEDFDRDERSRPLHISMDSEDKLTTDHGRRRHLSRRLLAVENVTMSANLRDGNPISDDVNVTPDAYVPTGNGGEIFGDNDEVDTGSVEQQHDVELWNTSSLTDLDLLPEDLSHSAKTFFIASYGIIVLTSVVFNSIVILVVIVSTKLRTITNVFFVSLAVSDLLIAVVNMPFQLLSVLRNEWTVGGEPLCKATNYVQGVVLVSSLLTLTGIAVDRYYAICRPLEARHLHTVRRAAILVGLFWVLSAVVVAPQLSVQRLEPVLVLDLRPPTLTTVVDSISTVGGTVVPVAKVRVAYQCVEYFSELHWNIAYTLFYYVVLYVLPMLTMFIAYGRIAVTLWTRTPPGEQLEHDVSSEANAKRLNERKRIVRMLVIIVGLFTLSWFPFFTAQVYILFVDYPDQSSAPSADSESTSISLRTAIACLQLIAYINCAVNPIVYCLLNERFQQRMHKMLRSLVRLLATKDRRIHNWQPRQRRRTLSETLQQRGHGPNNVANTTCGSVVNGIKGDGIAVTVRNGAVSERHDRVEINCKLRMLNFVSDNLARDILEDEESSDVLGDPFTPITEELPAYKIFVGHDNMAADRSDTSWMIRNV